MQQTLDDLVHHYSSKGPVILLESQSLHHPASTCSYLAARPEATIRAWGNTIEIQEGDEVSTFQDDPWDALSAFRKKWNDWLFGYLGYDLKNHIEELSSANPDNVEAPDLFFMVPAILFKIDPKNGTISSIKGKRPKSIHRIKTKSQLHINNLCSNVDKEDYLSIIKEAKQDIFEGNYYEINLSHQLQAHFEGMPFTLYQKMRDAGPVPFGSFLKFDDILVCSLSPERFLRKEGTTVFSQPIKGTMKRGKKKRKDETLRKKLIESPKNKAENLMIVDLVRNDLSRIATQGSVEVSNLFEVQTFDTVHQMVSTIKAETNIQDPIEIIKACYPMGSMTGAPKISAMESIERLENYRRGIYSGAIGYLKPDGDFDFNVVIRTAIIKNELLFYAVGGAITSDSDPKEEWEETLLKAQALTKTLN